MTICSIPENSTAQNFEEIIHFADAQFAVENYQLAVKEYQRALFFSKGRKVDYLYRQIAHSFLANKQLDQAAYFYELSYKTARMIALRMR
ncbi:MAG: hypothetical protein HC831_30855 [Chloroflexia bacterium]|nr:hypothetical protein [Chloroflexia bacterium]